MSKDADACRHGSAESCNNKRICVVVVVVNIIITVVVVVQICYAQLQLYQLPTFIAAKTANQQQQQQQQHKHCRISSCHRWTRGAAT